MFVIYSSHFTSIIFSSFIQFCWKIRKIFFLIFAIVSFTGMFLFVLYFDTESTHNDVFYNKLNFSSILNSIYTSYTIFTFENNLNIINFTLINNKMFLILLIPYFFFTLFLLTSFIISIICSIYTLMIQ